LGRPLAFDRQEALQKSTELFIQKGYSATSLSELVEAMEIVKPSFYNAFGSKEGLLLECLEKYSLAAIGMFQEALTKDKDLDKSISSFFSTVTKSHKARDQNPGCLIVSCALESDNPAVKAILQSHSKEIHGLIYQRIRRGFETESIVSNFEPKALASMIGIFLQGLSVSYKQGQSFASLKNAVKAMETFVLEAVHKRPSEDSLGGKSI